MTMNKKFFKIQFRNRSMFIWSKLIMIFFLKNSDDIILIKKIKYDRIAYPYINLIYYISLNNFLNNSKILTQLVS